MIIQIDFSSTFDRVNHQGILDELCAASIGGSVLSILTQFSSNRSQHVIIDSCRSKLDIAWALEFHTERNKWYILTHLGECGYCLQINPNYKVN